MRSLGCLTYDSLYAVTSENGRRQSVVGSSSLRARFNWF